MSTIIPSFELLFSIIFFACIFRYYYLGELWKLAEMLSIVAFTIILEYLSIKIYDAYSYSSSFVIKLGNPPNSVPIVIALAWSIIISTSMNLTDKTNLSAIKMPFLDTLNALIIDLSMDAVAIRIDGGLWSWHKVISNQITFDSYLGVRYGNFIGWYLIVLIFSFLLRYARSEFQLRPKIRGVYLSIIPMLAFIPFYAIFQTIQFGKTLINVRFYFPFVTLLLVIVSYMVINSKGNKLKLKSEDISLFDLGIFYCFHVFFFFSLIFLKMYQSAPLLLLSSILSVIIHSLVYRIGAIDSNDHVFEQFEILSI